MDSLDEVINAVSELLYVFEQAQADLNTDIIVDLRNLDALNQAIEIMVGEVRKNTQQIEDPNLRHKMEDANKGITGACDRLDRVIRNQPGGVIQRAAYQPLHDELRHILEGLVRQLQITDQVNVGIILECAKRNLDAAVRIRGCDTLNGLVMIAKELNKLGGDLQSHMKARIAETTDVTLRQRMTDSTEEVRDVTPIAINAAQSSIERPSQDNKEQKERSLKRLLLGLKELVDAVQMSGKYIQDYCLIFGLPPLTAQPKQPTYARKGEYKGGLGPKLDKLEKAVKRRDHPGAKQATKEIEDPDWLKKLREKLKRVPNKDAYEKDLNELERLLPHMLRHVPKATDGDPKANQDFDEFLRKARELLRKVGDLDKPEKNDYLANRNRANEALERIPIDARNLADGKAQPDRLVEDAKNLAEAIKRNVADARAAANHIHDPAIRNAILRAADELEDAGKNVVARIKEYIADPKSGQARKNLQDAVDDARRKNDALPMHFIHDELNKNSDDLNNELDNAVRAIGAGAHDAANDHLRNAVDLINRRKELGNELLPLLHDPRQRAQVGEGIKRLDELTPQLMQRAEQAMSGDGAAFRDLENNIVPEIKLAASAIHPYDQVDGLGMDPNYHKEHLAEKIIKNADEISGDLKDVGRFAHGRDPNETNAATDRLGNILGEQVDLAHKLANMVDDPKLRAAMLEASRELERLFPQIVAAARGALKGESGADNQLDDHLRDAEKWNRDLAAAANEVLHPSKRRPDLSRRYKEMTSLSRKPITPRQPPPPPPSNEPGWKSLISAAKNARSPIPESAELNKIAANVAQEMENLAAAAQRGDVKDMIEISRRIASMIQQIQGLSSEIAKKCKDPNLRDLLLKVSRVPKNFAVQLKILSAVKAGSSGDNSSIQQLMTCANGLAGAVVNTVHAAEGAAVASL